MKPRLLLAEDEPSLRETLTAHLEELGYEVMAAESATSALNRLAVFDPDLVLSDVQMPGLSGFDFLSHLRQTRPHTDVVIFTGHADVGGAIRAMKSGAADYLIKPLDLEETEGVIARCLARRRALSDARPHLSKDETRMDPAHGLVGRHSSIMQVYKAIGAASETNAPVLVQGETGTGKELVAQAIHAVSPRSNAPFVGVNCAALPAELLDSELFGHVKGAFTGATSDRRGKFDIASNGTLFLDEIGDTSLAFQAKLLRVLQEKEYYAVGDDRPRKTDTRIITATHRPLKRLVEEGKFRQDLLFRLQVIVIPVPPLRHRRSDIPLLVRYLLARASERAGKTPPVVPPEVMESLIWRDWPGNVRELDNVVTRALVMGRGPSLTLEDVDVVEETDPTVETPPQPVAPVGPASLADIRSSAERDHVQSVLQYTGGNKSRAARLLGISRPTLNRMIEDYELVRT